MNPMLAFVRTRPFAIWIVLVGATLCSLLLFEEFHSGESHRIASVGVIAVAFIKVRFVGLDFMELRDAPLPVRLVFEGWLAAIAIVLIVMYWMQSSVS